ncbi:hypothetical protein HDU82_001614 [Entophlyctis luteolus]|nr:hypothetical protein HDU82_001614 [Entophlyctis luteolus]
MGVNEDSAAEIAESGLRLLHQAEGQRTSYGSRESARPRGKGDAVAEMYSYSHVPQGAGHSIGNIYQVSGGHADAMREHRQQRAEQQEEMQRAYDNYTRINFGGVSSVAGPGGADAGE